MNVTTFKKSYWNYFLELEEQLISTKRFVTFDKNNFKSFSIEYLKLFQAVFAVKLMLSVKLLRKNLTAVIVKKI